MARRHKQRVSKEYNQIYALIKDMKQECYKDIDSLCGCLCPNKPKPSGSEPAKTPEDAAQKSQSTNGLVHPV